jgi:hypothetical protein
VTAPTLQRVHHQLKPLEARIAEKVVEDFALALAILLSCFVMCIVSCFDVMVCDLRFSFRV